MARYFFHLHNDVEVRDDEGIELADDAAARGFAITNARDMAAHSVRGGRLNLTHSIEVVAANRRAVTIVSFSDAVAVRWTAD